MGYAIEASNLYKSYNNVNALEDLTLNIEKGKSFGFLGPNGAGKTTFVKIILNLISADSGSSKLLGIDSKETLSRARVGFLPENMPIYPFLSVEEFLQFHAKLIDLPAGESAKEVETALKMTGTISYKEKKMGALSKGMRQRTGIAQAILANPELLILDEPTSGLDPIGIKDVRDILLQMKDKGATIFLNSHLLSEIEKTCDTIAILNKGKIIHTTDSMGLAEEEGYLLVKAEGISETIINEINAIASKEIEIIDEGLKVFLGSDDDSIKVHEIIIRNGGKLLSLAWKGESLEDVFYRLVKEKEE